MTSRSLVPTADPSAAVQGAPPASVTPSVQPSTSCPVPAPRTPRKEARTPRSRPPSNDCRPPQGNFRSGLLGKPEVLGETREGRDGHASQRGPEPDGDPPTFAPGPRPCQLGAGVPQATRSRGSRAKASASLAEDGLRSAVLSVAEGTTASGAHGPRCAGPGPHETTPATAQSRAVPPGAREAGRRAGPRQRPHARRHQQPPQTPRSDPSWPPARLSSPGRHLRRLPASPHPRTPGRGPRSPRGQPRRGGRDAAADGWLTRGPADALRLGSLGLGDGEDGMTLGTPGGSPGKVARCPGRDCEEPASAPLGMLEYS